MFTFTNMSGEFAFFCDMFWAAAISCKAHCWARVIPTESYTIRFSLIFDLLVVIFCADSRK